MYIVVHVNRCICSYVVHVNWSGGKYAVRVLVLYDKIDGNCVCDNETQLFN